MAQSCKYLDMLIAAALFSDSQSRIFRWLFGQPDRGFHLSELRRLTGFGSTSLQRRIEPAGRGWPRTFGARRQLASLSS